MKGKVLFGAVLLVAAIAWLAVADASYGGGVQTGAAKRISSNNSYSAPVIVVPAVLAPRVSAPPVSVSSSASAGEEQEAPADRSARANVEVRVPASAELWFEGQKTSQAGSTRLFSSPVLEPGKAFGYTIRAHWTSPTGQVVDETREIKVRAGRRTVVDFLGP
jgi:uncharacterized protein (TIGR03000 family)